MLSNSNWATRRVVGSSRKKASYPLLFPPSWKRRLLTVPRPGRTTAHPEAERRDADLSFLIPAEARPTSRRRRPRPLGLERKRCGVTEEESGFNLQIGLRTALSGMAAREPLAAQPARSRHLAPSGLSYRIARDSIKWMFSCREEGIRWAVERYTDQRAPAGSRPYRINYRAGWRFVQSSPRTTATPLAPLLMVGAVCRVRLPSSTRALPRLPQLTRLHNLFAAGRKRRRARRQ